EGQRDEALLRQKIRIEARHLLLHPAAWMHGHDGRVCPSLVEVRRQIEIARHVDAAILERHALHERLPFDRSRTVPEIKRRAPHRFKRQRFPPTGSDPRPCDGAGENSANEMGVFLSGAIESRAATSMSRKRTRSAWLPSR